MANPEHLAKVLNEDEWNEWREYNPAVKPDLSGADLRGETLGGRDFRNVNFREADLRGASFLDSDIAGADFTRARLARADMSFLSFVGVSLEDAELSGTQIDGADLLHVINLRAEDIELAHWCHCDKNLKPILPQEILYELYPS